MNKHFYLKMAVQSIRKNKRIYVPFILASGGMVALYCIFSCMAYNTGLELIRGGRTVKMVLNTGCRIMEIFSVIFMFYTNSFLIKQRKQELGLYSVLGMEKKHIAKILARETLICAILSISGGFLFGILLSRAFYILLIRILGNVTTLAFMVPLKAAGRTFLIFLLLFLGIYIYNSSSVRMIRPLELLQSGKKGEKEPKAKWISAILSAGMLGAGYYLAITCVSPIAAMPQFFTAVLLVIAGTYGLFQSVIIAVLKLLQKKKSYYYKTNHFVAVSGLQYRMKRNGVSLANICILSTAVLVMVSTTATIYAYQAGKETNISVEGNWQGEEKSRKLEEELLPVVEKYGKSREDVFSMKSAVVFGEVKENSFEKWQAAGSVSENMTVLELIDAESFEKSFGEKVALKEGEALVYAVYGEPLSDKITLGGREYTVKEYRKGRPYPSQGSIVSKQYFVVVKEQKEVQEIAGKLSQTGTFEDKDYWYYWYLSPDMDRESEISLAGEMKKVAEKYDYRVKSGEEEKGDFLAANGSLLFIGVFLGIVFMLATVLIIYYKQLTEGYEDRERFEIMCKVGMSRKEVKAAIRSQVLLVFFLPAATAGVHLLAAAPCLRKILMLFGVLDMRLFAASLLGTYAVFTVIYVLVYWRTAKTYYKIVNAK